MALLNIKKNAQRNEEKMCSSKRCQIDIESTYMGRVFSSCSTMDSLVFWANLAMTCKIIPSSFKDWACRQGSDWRLYDTEFVISLMCKKKFNFNHLECISFTFYDWIQPRMQFVRGWKEECLSLCLRGWIDPWPISGIYCHCFLISSHACWDHEHGSFSSSSSSSSSASFPPSSQRSLVSMCMYYAHTSEPIIYDYRPSDLAWTGMSEFDHILGWPRIGRNTRLWLSVFHPPTTNTHVIDLPPW